MRRSPRVTSPIHWAVAAVTALLALLLGTPAAADTATAVDRCSSGDRSYSSVGSASVTATAPEGYRIASFCVVGRGNAGAETHALSAPQKTAVVSHSSGKQLASYSVTYVRIPVVDVPEAAEETTAEKETVKAAPTPTAKEADPEPSRSAPAEELAAVDEVAPPSLRGDGEELQITTFEEKDDGEDRRSFLVVGAIILIGLLAGAIALLVRIPGQR
ncbi:MAG: hypothetical protein ACRDPS_13200 [Nocardioides sp.]|uniref:hypothetical protein n=1 Tax=Nocardioides sp. TaxID=35761 RepID=UPI003D6C1A98